MSISRHAFEDVETRWKGRLRDGLEQNLSLVIVKSVLALRDREVSGAEISEVGAKFGARYRERGWRSGLTILSAMNNMLPWLKDEDQVLALYHGMVHTARETCRRAATFPAGRAADDEDPARTHQSLVPVFRRGARPRRCGTSTLDCNRLGHGTGGNR